MTAWSDEQITDLAKTFDGDGMPNHCSAVLSGTEIIDFARAFLAHGIETAAKWVDQRRFDFEKEHGFVDHETGVLEFGAGQHAQLKEEYAGELAEIADGIRALKGQQSSKEQNT